MSSLLSSKYHRFHFNCGLLKGIFRVDQLIYVAVNTKHWISSSWLWISMNKQLAFFYKSAFLEFFFSKVMPQSWRWCGLYKSAAYMYTLVHLYMSAAYTRVQLIHKSLRYMNYSCNDRIAYINQTKEQSNIFPWFNPLCTCSFTIGENDEVNLNECQELERLQSV